MHSTGLRLVEDDVGACTSKCSSAAGRADCNAARRARRIRTRVPVERTRCAHRGVLLFRFYTGIRIYRYPVPAVGWLSLVDDSPLYYIPIHQSTQVWMP